VPPTEIVNLALPLLPIEALTVIDCIVLSLKLGVISLLEQTRQDAPILLLDDVDSELDEKRRAQFFEYILTSPRQVFITGTNADIVKHCTNDECKTMRLLNGVLSKI